MRRGSETLGAYVFFVGGGGDLAEAAALSASMQFTALVTRKVINPHQNQYWYEHRLMNGCISTNLQVIPIDFPQ